MLALKLMSLTAIPLSLIPLTLFSGHSLSRFASTSLLYTHRYVREDLLSKAKPLARQINLTELGIAAFFGVAPLLFFVVQGIAFWKILLCLGTVWGRSGGQDAILRAGSVVIPAIVWARSSK
jgi:hypothetical protein